MVDNDLIPLETDLIAKVDSAQRGGEKVLEVMKEWLQKAETAKAKTSELNNGSSQITSCFTGWFSQRYRLGKEASKNIVSVSDILKDGRDLLKKASSSGQALKENPYPVTYYAPPQSIPVKHSEIFASQESTKHQILTALKDNQVNMVGVYGMGGVGKTTLMSQIMQDTKISSQFENVSMVTISQNRRLENIQTEIAEKLGMKFEETSVAVRAMRLYARLKQAKSLLILDDMWEELNLEEVGIPRGKDHCGCKVVMTTRMLHLCTPMNAQISIEVKILEENESWELFCQVSGNALNSNAIQSLAKLVVGECKGLPLAIDVLAKALKSQKQEIWAIALKQMKKSIYEGMSPALSSIRLSYNYLESKDAKLFFLLCCLFPQDWKISMDEILVYAGGKIFL